MRGIVLSVTSLLALLASCTAEAGAGDAPPPTSIYRLDAVWRDQHGTERRLLDFAGQPVLCAMIFTGCRYACPRIIADLKAIEATLTESGRSDVHFVLPSMDDARDTPEVLAAFAAEHELDGERWHLLHGDADAVRELSAALDVRYRRAPSGSFSHSNRITLLDQAGDIMIALDGLGAPAAALIDRLLRAGS